MALRHLSLFALGSLLTTAAAQLRWERVPLFEGRSGHAAAFDASRGRLVVFGGRLHDGLVGETWEWDGAAWARRSPAHSPSPRDHHAMVSDTARGRVLLFGGLGPGFARLGDTWEWDGSDWTQLQPAHAPSGRGGHAMAWDSQRQRTVLFGGTASGYLDDTWEWDGQDWVERLPAHRPPLRTQAAMTFVAHRGRTFLFAGACPIGGPCAYRDAWEWDGSDWTPAPGTFPTFGRWGHQVVYDAARQRVVLFGGSDEPSHYYDDTWEWDGSTWQQVVPARNVPGRELYAMVYDPRLQAVVLTGGVGWAGAIYSDVWAWRGPPAAPSWLLLAEEQPTARELPTFAWLAATQRAVMFGGMLGFGETWEWDGERWFRRDTPLRPPEILGAQMASNDRRCWLVTGWTAAELWSWDGVAWQRTPTATAPPGGDAHALAFDAARGQLVLLTAGTALRPSETFTFDGIDWRLRQPAHAPPTRSYHALAHDAVRQRVVLFGGEVGSSRLNDTWEWDGNDWTQRQPAHVPPARSRHRLVHDEARQRTIVLGWNGAADQSIWEWDGNDWLLRAANAPGPGWPALLGAAYDRARSEVIVFAGAPAQTWRLRPQHLASYTAFGHGCRGQNGVPTLAAAGGQRPWLGDAFTVAIGNLPPVPYLILFLGASRRAWGPVLLPASLDHLGMAGCTLFASGEVPIPLVAANGRATWTMTLPVESSLAGATFYNQSWQIDWLANPGNATVSNAAEAVVGIR